MPAQKDRPASDAVAFGGGDDKSACSVILLMSCDRKVVAGRFMLPRASLRRVTLRIGPERGGCQWTWISLTAAEAVQLADALVAQAEMIADGEACPDGDHAEQFSEQARRAPHATS